MKFENKKLKFPEVTKFLKRRKNFKCFFSVRISFSIFDCSLYSVVLSVSALVTVPQHPTLTLMSGSHIWLKNESETFLHMHTCALDAQIMPTLWVLYVFSD